MDQKVFPKKYAKIIDSLPEFKESADSLSLEELNNLIVKCEGNIYLIEQEMEKDVKLAQAKELVKDLAGAYKDGKKVQTAKLKYALYLTESKGKEVGGNTQ